MKKYELTPEHQARFPEWVAKWTANAFSTAPMTDTDRTLCAEAVHKMYALAGLKAPRVVFVPSPFVLRFASGFAAAIWYLRKKGALRAPATGAATGDATWAATRAATGAATGDATRAATGAATGDATWAATGAATGDATWAATGAARRRSAPAEDDSKWFSGFDVRAMLDLNNQLGLGELGLACAENAFNMYQGGNQWSDLDALYTFFRDVAQLPIDWSHYAPWNTLCEHSGPRVAHEEFCMISDRPEALQLNDMNEPHCENGPFCRWRDGSELYAINGVRVPKWVVMSPARITVEKIDAEESIEVRRIMIERLGHARYLQETGAQVVDLDSIPIGGGVEGAIIRALLKDKNGLQYLCGHDGSTDRVYYMSVDPQTKTCGQAHESICGFPEERIVANA